MAAGTIVVQRLDRTDAVLKPAMASVALTTTVAVVATNTATLEAMATIQVAMATTATKTTTVATAQITAETEVPHRVNKDNPTADKGSRAKVMANKRHLSKLTVLRPQRTLNKPRLQWLHPTNPQRLPRPTTAALQANKAKDGDKPLIQKVLYIPTVK